MKKIVKLTGLAALGAFGVLSLAACGTDQVGSGTPATTVNADQSSDGAAAGYSHKKETGPVHQGTDGTDGTTPTYSHKKDTGPVRPKGMPGSTTFPRATPGPAGEPVPVTNTVEIESVDGYDLHVRNMRHVSGGANNGHWEVDGSTYTVHISYDTAYYAELSLCPGGDGVGKRRCAADDAIDTLQHNGSGMLAAITFDGYNDVSKLQEVYVP